MKRQDYYTATGTLAMFTIMATVVSGFFNDEFFFIALMFPVFISWLTLPLSDYCPDWAKITFWWPFYL